MPTRGAASDDPQGKGSRADGMKTGGTGTEAHLTVELAADVITGSARTLGAEATVYIGILCAVRDELFSLRRRITVPD